MTLAALALLLPLVFATPALAATDVFKDACKKGGTQDSAVCLADGGDPLTGTKGLIYRITRIVALIAGIAAVIIMIVGGLIYVMSGGDTAKVNTAKDTVLYAAVGLIVIVLAQTLIVFIINRI